MFKINFIFCDNSDWLIHIGNYLIFYNNQLSVIADDLSFS